MSATALDVTTIEHLDFKHVQACEHSRHADAHADQAAMFFVRARCLCAVTDYFLCLSGWELFGRVGIRCVECGRRATRDGCITILRVIGSPS